MKSVVLFFIGVFLFAKFGPAIPLSMVTTNKTDFFTVTGEGKATAVPDIAQISLGITVNGASVALVQSQANSTINDVTAAVKKLGVGDKDVQTSNYNLRLDYDFANGRQSIKGYVADINLSVKVRQFDKINQVIDAATAAGANQVGGLNFTLDDASRLKAEGEARKLAIDQAKTKAAQIAAASGLNLGRIINVSESPNFSPRPIMMSGVAKADSAAAPTEIQPGSSEISVSVTLSYETR
ncbi:SIMPL domain-containing protein [Candidatus Microgenomates bacterium]|nr:SIMPL domain-containing protein [Candidatus Microgenomates bacterium]